MKKRAFAGMIDELNSGLEENKAIISENIINSGA